MQLRPADQVARTGHVPRSDSLSKRKMIDRPFTVIQPHVHDGRDAVRQEQIEHRLRCPAHMYVHIREPRHQVLTAAIDTSIGDEAPALRLIHDRDDLAIADRNRMLSENRFFIHRDDVHVLENVVRLDPRACRAPREQEQGGRQQPASQ